jgi:16S rRNA (guanine966-N2)-methyltransferase
MGRGEFRKEDSSGCLAPATPSVLGVGSALESKGRRADTSTRPEAMRITGGFHRGRNLRTPKAAGLRPTTERVRGAIFSILGQGVCKGARVLDLYAGTGIMGIEALSRDASWADFVEVDGKLVRQIHDNLDDMSLAGKSRVYRAKVESVLGRLVGGYDLVFSDPPYRLDVWDELMGAVGERGFVNEGGAVVLEYRFGTDVSETYGVLKQDMNRRYGDTAIALYRT